MNDKTLSVKQELAELLKKFAEENKSNRSIFYAWCKKREEYWRNHVKAVVGDKLDVNEVDKIFDEANNYDLEKLVETDYDYTALSKEELVELLSTMKRAFDDIEGLEPEEDAVYDFNYDSLYNGWEDACSTLEDKINNLQKVLADKN